RGNYHLNANQLLAFHLTRLQTILSQHPDCIAIETQPQLFEVKTLLDWMQINAPQMPVYVSFTVQNPQTLSDGTPLKQAVLLVNNYHQVFAVGVNCLAPTKVLPAIQQIRSQTSKEIIVYPNLGSSYDPQSK
ncbi:homocysteine S-methyltransferase, partial [Lactobacillus sp. XV13L]|nr:homocysteine S-methyltransferase [Lactobacillus sp. XV13L]